MRLAVRLVLEMIGLGSARWGIDAPSADRCQQRVDYRVIYDVLDAELVPMGSAGVKVISVTRDITDAYVHAGGQYEWDNAAPVAEATTAAAGAISL